MPEGQRIADPVEALLDQLETLSGDAMAGDNIAPHPIDHRMRMLFSRCAHRLRTAQMAMETATLDAQIMNERSSALFTQASSKVSTANKRLNNARSARRKSDAESAEIIARAEAFSLEVLEHALELADSYLGHLQIGTDSVENWISEKAGKVAATMINDLESRIVEIGSDSDDAAPNNDTTSQYAA